MLPPIGSAAFTSTARQISSGVAYEPVGEARQLTEQASHFQGLAWTSDGGGIVYSTGSDRRNCSLWIVDIDKGKSRALPLPGDNLIRSAVSSEGDRLACVERSIEANIYTQKLTTAGHPRSEDPKKIIASSRGDFWPILSSDGNRVAFTSDRTGVREIYVSNIDGAGQRQITDFGGVQGGPWSWSPDGRLIAFDSRIEGQGDIYTVDVETGASRRITTHQAGDYTPFFSRDGRWLYFCSSRDGEWAIFKRSVGAGNLVQVTRGYPPRESLDGNYLLFVSPPGTSPLELRRRSLLTGEEDVLAEILGNHLWAPFQGEVLFQRLDGVLASIDLTSKAVTDGQGRLRHHAGGELPLIA